MGSSTVIILMLEELILAKEAYRVLDFPAPVGPVTKIMPWGFFMACSIFLRSSSQKPRFSRVRKERELNRRICTDSPNDVGMVETRRSISLFCSFPFILPS